MDLTAFTDAATDVGTAITTDAGPALAGVAVAGLGVGLVVRWIRGLRSAL